MSSAGGLDYPPVSMTGHRETWTSGSGFVLATIGAAVGLGNIWRFSYVAGENGGGAFLAVYLVSVLLVGVPIVIAELALGRRSRGDAVAAYEQTSVVCIPLTHGGRIGTIPSMAAEIPR